MSVAQLPRCTICQSSQHARPSASRYEFPECGSAWITHVTSCAPVRRIASATLGAERSSGATSGPRPSSRSNWSWSTGKMSAMGAMRGLSQARSATSLQPHVAACSRASWPSVSLGRVERVGRLRAHEATAVRDDVVHDDDRLLRGVVDRGVVRARRADVELRRELSVVASLRQDVGTRATRRGAPSRNTRAFGAHRPRSTVTRNRTFCASVFEESTSSTPTMRSPSPMSSSASAEPLRVEYRVERRRNGRLHGAERYDRDARRRLVVGRVR